MKTCAMCDKPAKKTIRMGRDKRSLCKLHLEQYENKNKEFFPTFIKASELE